MKTFKICAVIIAVSLMASCSKYYSNDISDTTWTVDFDWDIGGVGSTDITFDADGTHSWYDGTWTQDGTTISWSFDFTDGNGNTATATYEGIVALLAMSGTCSNTNGDSGTWTAQKQE